MLSFVPRGAAPAAARLVDPVHDRARAVEELANDFEQSLSNRLTDPVLVAG